MRSRRGARVREVLDLVELPSSVAERYPHELSGGQQQRVALARALAPAPALVLLDEPFSSLDAGLREDTGRAVARALRASGATAVLVTHDQGEALSLADQVAVMRAGRFLQVAPPSEIYLRPASPEVARFLGHATLLPGTASGGTATCDLGRVTVLTEVSGEVLLAIRPEQVSVSTVASDGVVADVLDVSYFGHDATLRARVRRPRHRGHRACPGRRGPEVGHGRVPARLRRRAGLPRDGRAMTVQQVGRRTTTHPLLGGRPDDVALLAGTGPVTYADLAARVEARAAELGATRRVVLLEAANDVDSVVTYLAALAGGHPVLLAAPGDTERHADLVDRYRPDVVQASGRPMREVRPGTGHDLHPDLAVLLSTSGSTGSPKLVRLSLANVLANARSIATYLGIRDTDRAITSLPLHYCYGLSVLNSHLVSGRRRRAHRPVGGRRLLLGPRRRLRGDELRRSAVHLRAPRGLRLPRPGRARRCATSPRPAGGWTRPASASTPSSAAAAAGTSYVMYGQTEATARMAYLPPDLAAEHPEAVGVPVPGGAFRLDAVGDDGGDGVGELVYTGPNVMMGYALEPADLARGAELTELRTGDLGRRRDDGLWEVVGRLGRHAKLFGLRLDLDRVERRARRPGAPRPRSRPRRAAVGVHRPAPRRRAHPARRPRPDRPARLRRPRRTSRRTAPHVGGQARLRDAGPARRTHAGRRRGRPDVGDGRGHP